MVGKKQTVSAAALTCALSCGAPAPTPPPPPAVSLPAPVPPAQPAPELTALSAPAAPTRPKAVKCTVRSTRLSSTLTVRPTLGSPGGLELHASAMTMLALTSSGDAFVDALGKGATAMGWVRRSDVVLHMQTAELFAGIAVPHGDAKLELLSVQDDGADVRLLRSDPTITYDAAPERRVRCTSLGAAHGRFSPLDAIPRAPHAFASLTAPQTAVSNAPGASSVAAINVSPPVGATIIARDGASVRIAYHGADSTIIGWVAASAIAPSNSPASVGGKSHSSKRSRARRRKYVDKQCPHAVPLILATAGSHYTIGSIHPATVIAVEVDGAEAMRPIRLPKTHWLATTKAELLVMAHTLSGCTNARGQSERR